MKTKNLFLLPALIASVGLTLAGRVTAQTFTTLHTFTALSGPISGPVTNSDGAVPKGLFLSGNTLYGAAEQGGPGANGAVFKVNTDGTGFTTLHSFTAQGPDPNLVINSDGAFPTDLVLSGNTLHGTASYGGSSGWGTVFAITTDGTGFTILHNFTHGSDGAAPQGQLILSGNTLYGKAGVVFAVKTDGTGFRTVYSGGGWGGLILSGNSLYGAAEQGGPPGQGYGMLFAVNTDGTDFTALHSFTEPAPDANTGTNSDGFFPLAGLILSGNTLYGTAERGGSSGYGTVFAVNTDGTDFTTLHSFTRPIPTDVFGDGNIYFINSDGYGPRARLILWGNTLYGTASKGGSSGAGTFFALNTDGTDFTTLHSFTAGNFDSSLQRYTNSDGVFPWAELILSGNTLYGTTSGGGSSGAGTVFSLSFRPQLTVILSGADIILTWPTNVAGFDYTGYTLQSTTNLVSPAVWTAVSPGPVVIDGQNAVTNLISGNQQFYRLSQ